MIVFVYGTTAELIKLSPIMRRLDDSRTQYEVWCTGQQFEQLEESAKSLNVRVADYWIAKGYRSRSLSKNVQVPFWLLVCCFWLLKNYRGIRRRFKGKKTVVIVHGDTMTTVVGAFIGKTLGLTVAHVEAGLRSHDVWNPFPEEIDRRLAAAFSNIHFAPDLIAETNLKNASGLIVNTAGNTSVDALRYQTLNMKIVSTEPYGLVLLHRSEFLRDKHLLSETFSLIMKEASLMHFYVVADALAFATFAQIGLIKEFETNSNITLLTKQSHQAFVQLLSSASFIITDSGGVQEESAVLGIPCFIHRKATERLDGIGHNCMLTDQNVGFLASMIANFHQYKQLSATYSNSPSKIIVDYLEESGF